MFAAPPPQADVRTIAGGRPITKPVVTYVLLGIDVAIFLLLLVAGADPAATGLAMSPFDVAQGAYWQLITSAFLHYGFLHIAFNMYVLFALGPTMERILGHSRYLLLFLLSALGGGVASYAFSEVGVVSLGASGAIFGLMGALVVAGRKLNYNITQVLVLLAINIAIGFLPLGGGIAIDWRAHLGGLVAGAAASAVFVLAPRVHRLAWQSAGVAAMILVMVLLVAWRTTQITSLFG
jgi:membrane associated rhomboid family serine protease